MLSRLVKLREKAYLVLRDKNGQGLVEYALILALIAVVVLLAIKGVGVSANSKWSMINSGLQ